MFPGHRACTAERLDMSEPDRYDGAQDARRFARGRGIAMKAMLFAVLSFAAALYAQPAEKPAPGEATSAAQPTPHLADGKVDLGGKGVWAPIWVHDWADKQWVDKSIDVPFTPAGLATFRERRANNSADDPEGYCLPAGVPRYTGTPYPFQMIQLPDRVIILYEGASHMYRIIMLNAKHSPDPDPTWLGESVGRYEGNDTLVVDTVGFNGRTWLDYVGHPASDELHVTERFTRTNYLTLRYEATIEDAKNYTRPWTTSFNIKFQPGWEIKEYVCLENNKDLLHLGTKEPK